MLEQLRNDVNSSNLMENGTGAGEGDEDDSYSDEAHVSVENRAVNGFENESFAVGSQQQANLDPKVTAALLASPP